VRVKVYRATALLNTRPSVQSMDRRFLTNVLQGKRTLGLCSDNLFSINQKLECGPMPNVMAALPNIGGALCSTPQSLADAHCWTTVQ